MTDHAAARLNMVDNQIRTNKVTDSRVLQAMAEVPRELFVPKKLQGIAYVDEDLAVAPGRYLMEPLVLARLLQAAAITAGDVVLDVGCASGYSTAVLARLAATVVAVESDAELGERASALLSELDADNAVVVAGPLEAGYAKQAPYDAIVIGGAVEEVPAAITDQLAEGGRLLAVVTGGSGVGKGTLMLRVHGGLSRRVLFDAAVPPLPGFARARGFVF
ncbi:MAG: protein-L-isoaspartate O-methyltransferase [Alphaproteobacteria bacterium]